MTRRLSVFIVILSTALVAGCGPKIPPAAPGAPHFPEFVFPAPAAAAGSQLEGQRAAWNALQAGNLGGAERQFNDLLRRFPRNATIVAGLGYVALARHDFTRAVTRFDEAMTSQPTLAAALVGKGLALVELGRAGDAIGSFEAAQKADSSLDLSARIEALRFRAVEDAVAKARAAMAAGKLDEARDDYTRALAASPDSALLLRELAAVERKTNRLAEARTYLERAVAVDPADRSSQVQLGELAEAEGNLDAAARAYEAAQAIEATRDVEARLTHVRERADLAKLPPEFQAIATAGTVTRGDLAALLGVRLGGLLQLASPMPATLVTDIRGHWAAPWIAMVLRAGVMEAFSNHTFQPQTILRRADLAEAIARVLGLVATIDPARAPVAPNHPPIFSDLPPSHPSYAAASRAVAAGVLDAHDGSAFEPTRPVTGAEVQNAVARLERLSGPRVRREATHP
jgi:tetratricopeptide (TPR) repeat protein